jgi:hypothetical protein
MRLEGVRVLNVEKVEGFESSEESDVAKLTVSSLPLAWSFCLGHGRELSPQFGLSH